jgi:hypothetical protein
VDQLLGVISQHPGAHVFIDECPAGYGRLSAEDVQQISDKVSSDSVLWIACRWQLSNVESSIPEGKIFEWQIAPKIHTLFLKLFKG